MPTQSALAGRNLLLAAATWGLALLALATMTGCPWDPLPLPIKPPEIKVPHFTDHIYVKDYGVVAALAATCLTLGTLAMIASFVPFLALFVPRKAAAVAIAIGFGYLLADRFLAKFTEAIIWAMFAAVIAGTAAGVYPFAVALVRWAQRKSLLATSDLLTQQGDVRAATALRVVALPEQHPTKAARLETMRRVREQANAMQPTFARKRRRGFTLVELLIVIVIVGILIGIVIPAIADTRYAADNTRCLSNLRGVVQTALVYSAQHKGAWPTDLEGWNAGDAAAPPEATACPAYRGGDDQGVYVLAWWTGAEIESVRPAKAVVTYDTLRFHPRSQTTLDALISNKGWGNRAWLDGHAGRSPEYAGP